MTPSYYDYRLRLQRRPERGAAFFLSNVKGAAPRVLWRAMAVNFVLVPSRYGDVVPTLKAAVPAFVSSEAYNLHEGQIDDQPGIVLATFAGFLGGVAEADPDSPIVADGLAVIADMLAWNDSETTAAIRDAFFVLLFVV